MNGHTSFFSNVRSPSSFQVYASVRPLPFSPAQPRRVPVQPIPVQPPRRYGIVPPSPPYYEVSAVGHGRAIPGDGANPQATQDTPTSQNPPRYTLPLSVPSLPQYRLLPQSAEEMLLLAPPPRYYHSAGDAEGQIHTNGGCGERESHIGDAVVMMLVVLNVMVWAAVVWSIIDGTEVP